MSEQGWNGRQEICGLFFPAQIKSVYLRNEQRKESPTETTVN